MNATEAILLHNPGLLLYYVFAEDHEWELKIFNKDELVFDYKCEWTDEFRIEKNRSDIELIRELVIQQY